MAALPVPSPAETAPDDSLICVFRVLASGFAHEAACRASMRKSAAARFVWFRCVLPAVCQRWRSLLLHSPASGQLWSTLVIDPAAEAHHGRRWARGGGAAGGAGAGSAWGSSEAIAAAREAVGPSSGCSTPVRGGSPALGSSPDSDASSYWSSVYAPYGVPTTLPGSSPPSAVARHQLARLSLQRAHTAPRAVLRAAALLSWLTQHAAVALGARCLWLDLSHHTQHDVDRASLDSLLSALPRLRGVTLLGAVDGTDAYEPLARLRSLSALELAGASQACLDGGLLALSFTPSLRALRVALDIAPASPLLLGELPLGLHSLSLAGMWLEELPRQLTALTGLTSVVLERCQLEANPLPLLLSLPVLATLTVRNEPRSAGERRRLRLLPMERPQLQLLPAAQTRRGAAEAAEAAAAAAGLVVTHPDADVSPQRGALSLPRTQDSSPGGARRRLVSRLARIPPDAASPSVAVAVAHFSGGSSSSSSRCGAGAGPPVLLNTSLTSLALVDVGLTALPGCVSQLAALQDLNLALNHELGAAGQAGCCLPPELLALTGLVGLCLGHCGLSVLPPVVAQLSSLTRLELQGNPLSGGSGSGGSCVAFGPRLRVLDLGGATGRGRARGVPSWVGSCSVLRELRISCHMLGHAALQQHHLQQQQQQQPHELQLLQGGIGAESSAHLQPSMPLPIGTVRGPAWPTTHNQPAQTAENYGLSLSALPTLLPELDTLYIDGGTWEQRAVRDALDLVRDLGRRRSRLRVILPL